VAINLSCWKKNIFLCILAGVVWGWVAMAVNNLTGVSPLEMGLAHNLITFSMAGAVFGLVAGGVLTIVEKRLPTRSVVLKAAGVSASIWLLLRSAGVVLSMLQPVRYHVSTPESVQGFALALFLGCILGVLWKRGLSAVTE